MNWPALSAECSKEIAAVLEEVVRQKPADLFEHVAQRLQLASGVEPEDFEARFEECKRRPRTFSLEDRCPADQDPLVWVPMRYNDEAIFQTLRVRSQECVADILSTEPLGDFEKFTDLAKVAFPELSYIRDTEHEIAALQALRAVYLGVSAADSSTMDDELEAADPALSFKCGPLVQHLRQLFEPLTKSEELVEASLVLALMRVLGVSPAFRGRFCSGATSGELAVLNAIDSEPESMPSFQRLGTKGQDLIIAGLQAWFPFDLVVGAEAVPAHLAKIKEAILPLEDGLDFFHCALVLEYTLKQRTTAITPEVVDVARLAGHALENVEKYTPPRAYEIYLKRRAERRQWRLAREDNLQRAAIRMACMMNMDDGDAWSAILEAVQGLSEREKEALRGELGRKDGLAESPAYVLDGGGAFLAAAHANDQVSLESAVLMLARILEDASRTFDKSLKCRVVRLCFGGLPARAKQFRIGDMSFEDLAFSLEETAPGEVQVRVAGC